MPLPIKILLDSKSERVLIMKVNVWKFSWYNDNLITNKEIKLSVAVKQDQKI